MSKIILIFVLMFGAQNCFAGELVRDATIIEVASNVSGADFGIRVSGGTGICAIDTWIVFPEAKAVSPTTHALAIANVMLAFSKGRKVRIYNYQDNSCSGANFISVLLG
jgi:hypothetical protein